MKLRSKIFVKPPFFKVFKTFLITGGIFGLSLAAVAQDAAQGIKMIDTERYEKAKVIFKSLTAQDAKNYFYLGNVYLLQSKPDSAEWAYKKGVEANAQEALNYVGLGRIALDKNNTAEAESNFQKALTMTKERDANVLMQVGYAYLNSKSGNAKRAVELAEKAIARDKKSPDVYIFAGDAYVANRDGGQGMNNYEKAAEIAPQYAKVYYKMGNLYRMGRVTNMAVQNYEKAVEVDPDFAPAYQELGVLYNQQKQYDKAKAAYKKFIDISENNLRARYTYASFLFLSKQYDAMLKEIDNIFQTDSSNIFMYRLRGYALNELKDYNGSVQALTKFLSGIDTSKVMAEDYEYLAKSLSELGQDSVAVQYVDKALALDKSNVDLYIIKGKFQFKQKDYAGAATTFQGAIDQRKTPNGNDYYWLGRALYYNKQYVEADSAFSKLVSMYPESIQGHFWRARSNAALDPESKAGAAKPFYEATIEKGQTDPEKNKAMLIEAYKYLGAYYYQNKKPAESKPYWQKVKELDPKDEEAANALKVLQ